jgi:hypothetical protein
MLHREELASRNVAKELLYFKDVKRERNPFSTNNVSRLATCEQRQLIDMSCDGSLKDKFGTEKLSSATCKK